MTTEVISVPSLISVAQLVEAIKASHSAYPVTNTANRLVGMIPRTMLIVLGREKIFYPKSRIINPENFASATSPGIKDRKSEVRRALTLKIDVTEADY